ncbi:hypothetical protein JRO89_XS05G0231900 [Xanthoceras sorbifolium]|uniref:Polyprotein n=1 Tax=Xanthoceras sorbifolium TaxID=99658 RepID=A0ABQ8I2Y9_9ROSI|nr:hypothetical protein JRO89_XS05G0231900 [Xanthoceras sorbifolium]
MRSLVGKDICQWDLILAQAEFAYNRSTSQTTDAEAQAKQIKKLHEQVCDRTIKQNQKYQAQANKHKKPTAFKEGDLVWVILRKERFPRRNNRKLKPGADGHFKVLKGIG